jgi:hypothetical protein
MTGDNHRTHDHEPVLAAKVSAEMFFRNASVVVPFMLFIADKSRVALMMPVTVFVLFVAVGMTAAMSMARAVIAIIVAVPLMPVTIMVMLCHRRYRRAHGQYQQRH